ncbi:MAG: metallophosphoesterase [Thermoprotei archaeon]
MDELKVLFVSDLHGSEVVYGKVANSARFYGVPNVVVGGDLTGKLLVSIVDKGGGEYALEFMGEKIVVDSTKLEVYKKKLREAGQYYRVLSKDEFEDVSEDKSKVKTLFLEEMRSTLALFLEKWEEKFKPIGAKLYVIPGNDDYPEVASFLNTLEGDTIKVFDERVVEFGGYQLAGFGYANPTPWNTPRELPEDEIYIRLTQITAKADARTLVVVAHPPPYNTLLDLAPKLKDFKPVMVGGEVVKDHVGSTSVRRLLEEKAPLIGLHGHIHESPGADRLHPTGESSRKNVPVFNPGSEYNMGVLRGVLLSIRGENLSYIFTRG